jgi:ketosteroid isomerase-like protein
MHTNEQILRQADEAQLAGEFARFLDYYTNDVVVHVPGRSRVAGVYKGKEQYAEGLQRLMAISPGYRFQPHAYFADDEHGVSLEHAHYERGDEFLDIDQSFVFHFRDVKIAEVWAMPVDQYVLDAFMG